MSIVTPPSSVVKTHIRWLIPRDMPEILNIESESFKDPSSEEDFGRWCFLKLNHIGIVVEVDCQIAGFMIYELHETRLHLIKLAVGARWRRRGLASQMVEKLKSKLSSKRRTRIVLEVRETNLAAQLFLRRQGFRAVRVLENFYEDTPPEDAYLMHYRHQSA